MGQVAPEAVIGGTEIKQTVRKLVDVDGRDD